jgi:hypothetical protein
VSAYIPALTVRQPWATALVNPDLPKTVETRTKANRSNLNKPVAIIAGLHNRPWWSGERADGRMVGHPEPWASLDDDLERWVESEELPQADGNYWNRLRPSKFPYGAIVGTVVFVESLPIGGCDYHMGRQVDNWYNGPGRRLVIADDSGPGQRTAVRDITAELPWGDYTPGRWAWVTDPTQTVMFDRPVPCGGKQGFQFVPITW